MSVITENLIHASDAVSSPSSSLDESEGSRRTPTPTTQNVPQKRPPSRIDGKKNHTDPYSTQKKRIKCQHENVECVCEIRLGKKPEFSVLSVVFLYT